MNSFRSVERAIEYEIDRQAAALDAGEPLAQETRGWSDERGATYRMRLKETSDDYRYFPEPDLPPLHVAPDVAGRVRGPRCRSCPPPAGRRYRDVARAERLRRRACWSPIRTRRGLFEATLAADPALAAKSVANWVTGRVPAPAQRGRADAPVAVAPAELAAIVAAVEDGSISRAQGKEVLEAHVADAARPRRRSSRRAASARSRTPARSGRPSTRSWPPTRRPSPTTGRARSRRSASWSVRS